MEILRAETNEFPHLKVCIRFFFSFDKSIKYLNRIPMVQLIIIIIILHRHHQRLMMMMKIDFQMLVSMKINEQ